MMGDQTVDEAKQALFNQTGYGDPPPAPLAPPERRQLRPYDDPRVADLPPGQGVVGNTALTLDIVEKNRQRSQATGDKEKREREKTARESRAQSQRRQELQRSEEATARTLARLEADRGRGEARLGQLADEYRTARGQVPTEGAQRVVLAAVVSLRERFDAAVAVARQLETLEVSVNMATVQHQCAAWKRDNPSNPLDDHWAVKIAHGDAGPTIPRRAGDFLVAVGLPGDPEPSTAELAGAGAARVLEPMVRAQRELNSIG